MKNDSSTVSLVLSFLLFMFSFICRYTYVIFFLLNVMRSMYNEKRSRCSNILLIEDLTKTDMVKKSCSYKSITRWNALENQMRSIQDVDAFKKSLKCIFKPRML